MPSPPLAGSVATLLQQLNDPAWLGLGTFLLIAILVYVVLVGRWMFYDARRRGHNAPLWVFFFVAGSIPAFMIIGLVVLILYFSVRHPIRYDERGQLEIPKQPPTLEAAPPPGPSVTAIPRGQPAPSLGAPTAASLARVKCPYCQHIFPYQRASGGPTRVKCPACGQEGNI